MGRTTTSLGGLRGGSLQYRTKMIPPPAGSAGLVNTFYMIETEGGRFEEPVPAYSAQIMLMVRGNLTMTFADGSVGKSATVTINAPQMRSARCVLEGPVLQIGASLTHASWQRLANLPADRVHDQLIPAEKVLTPAQLDDPAAQARRAEALLMQKKYPEARSISAQLVYLNRYVLPDWIARLRSQITRQS